MWALSMRACPLCTCFCESMCLPTGVYLHISIYQGAPCQCSPFILFDCAPLSSYITHNYPQERDSTDPWGWVEGGRGAHTNQNNKGESMNMQTVHPLNYLLLGCTARAAGKHKLISLAAIQWRLLPRGLYSCLRFIIRDMMYGVARQAPEPPCVLSKRGVGQNFRSQFALIESGATFCGCRRRNICH